MFCERACEERLENDMKAHNKQMDIYLYKYLYYLLISRELVSDNQKSMVISSLDE